MVHSYLEILEVIDYYCCRRNFNLPDLQVVNKLNICAESIMNKLDENLKKAMGKELSAQLREIFGKLEEAGNRHTQYNFLVNAG